MKKFALSLCVAGLLSVSAMGCTAFAEVPSISVSIDQSQILQLQTTPGAIVLGNPAIADVSIQGQKLFIHGRSFGQTNLTILDLQGNQIATFNLVGKLDQPELVTYFRGPDRLTYSCNDTCNPNIQVGDNDDYFQTIKQQTNGKFSLATGSSTAEAKAPEAPQ